MYNYKHLPTKHQLRTATELSDFSKNDLNSIGNVLYYIIRR